MNKFLSTITLTGMLTASILGTGVNAATKASVRPVNFYQNLINNKIVVPIMLSSKDDSVTKTQLAESFKEKGLTIKDIKNAKGESIAADTKVGTGAVVTVNQNKNEYTVVIYGDVNGDGVVAPIDSLYTLKHGNNDGVQLNDVQKLAANVRNKTDKIDPVDSLYILNFSSGKLTDELKRDLVEVPLKGETVSDATVKDVTINSATKVTVTFDKAIEGAKFEVEKEVSKDKTETKYVSATAEESNTKYVLNLSGIPLEAEKKTTLRIYDEDKNLIESRELVYVSLAAPNNITVPKTDDNVENAVNSKTENNVSIRVSFPKYATAQGRVILTLRDSKNKLEFTSDLVEAQAAYVDMNGLDLSSLEDGTISATAKFVDLNGNESATSTVKKFKKYSEVLTISGLTFNRANNQFTLQINNSKSASHKCYYKVIAIDDNNIPDVDTMIKEGEEVNYTDSTTGMTVKANLIENKKAYKLCVVAVNAEGTPTDKVYTTIIESKDAKDFVGGILKVALDVETGVVTWEEDKNDTENISGYKVVLKNGSTIEKEIEVGANEREVNLYDAIKDIELGNGVSNATLTVAVIAQGDGVNYKDSDPETAPEHITLAKLANVTSLTVKDCEATWKSTQLTDTEEFKVELLKQAEDGTKAFEVVATKTVGTALVDDKLSCNFKDEVEANGNGAYKIAVTAIAKNSVINKTNSEEVQSTQFTYVVKPTNFVTSNVKDNKVTFKFDKYPASVKITSYSIATRSEASSDFGTPIVVTPIVDKDNSSKMTFDVTGLTADTNYEAKLIIKVGSVSYESDVISFRTLAESIPDSTYTIGTNLSYDKDTDKITASGIQYKATAPNFETIKSIITTLDNGDIVKVVDDKIEELTLTENGTRVVDIAGLTNPEKCIVTTTATAKSLITLYGDVKDLKLNADANVDLTAFNAEQVTLITASKAYTINNIKITPKTANTVVYVKANALEITGAKGLIEIDASEIEANTTVGFVANNQTGIVTVIGSDKHVLTIDANEINLTEVKVTEGKVDVSDTFIRKVSVPADSKVELILDGTAEWNGDATLTSAASDVEGFENYTFAVTGANNVVLNSTNGNRNVTVTTAETDAALAITRK